MNSSDINEKELSLDKDMKAANEFIIHYLQDTMNDSRNGLKTLNRKLNVSYGIVIGFSVTMFALGIILVAKPLFSSPEEKEFLFSAVGVVDLFLLFLFRPFDVIHGTMGDMSQIILAINSFQAQVGLRLMEMDAAKRGTIGQAANHINAAAKDSIKLVQHYFETKRATLGGFSFKRNKSRESVVPIPSTPPRAT